MFDVNAPVLVTGASGFIGSVLLRDLVGHGLVVRALVRSEPAEKIYGVSYYRCRDISRESEWCESLTGAGAVVHLAGAAHRLDRKARSDHEYFRSVNLAGMNCLLRAMEREHVRRFIYLSTLKVHGDSSVEPLRADSPLMPSDAYAASKHEAEEALRNRLLAGGLEGIVIRPPLVYGPGVKGNFLQLMKVVSRGLPLPLAGVRNKRSLISLANLCDLVCCCLLSDHSAGKTFMASDGQDLSTPQLIRMVAAAMKKRARLFPLPERLLGVLGTLLGAKGLMLRLCGSLQVDISQTCQTLNWSPPFDVRQGVQETVDHWLRH